MKHRCKWVQNAEKIYIKYHDEVWGTPMHKDQKLFEMLILEGAQAGLSWITVLKKQKNYRKAFDNFNPKKVAKYNDKKVQELLKNEGIIRNKLKINSAIRNAKVFLEIQKEFGSFDKYIWGFVNYIPINPRRQHISEIPSQTDISEKISKDLKKRGMNFIGPTIIYAYMQAIGMINDHEVNCFRYKELT